MNISIDIENVVLPNIYFLDKKRNIIMDGNFTKIIYSNDWFTMNGLYILFPIEVISIEKYSNNNILKFHTYQSNNLQIIEDIAKLEYRIIEYYKNIYHCKSRICNSVAKQLYSGSMKLYKELNTNQVEKNKQYIIKISGIWETQESVGLTYKLIEVNENYI